MQSVRDMPIEYGASYKSVAALAANTPETVFTPATNARGAIVWVAEFVEKAGSFTCVGSKFIAHTATPAAVTDGDTVTGVNASSHTGTEMIVAGRNLKPIKIPAGKGLYFWPNVLETNSSRSVLYTLF